MFVKIGCDNIGIGLSTLGTKVNQDNIHNIFKRPDNKLQKNKDIKENSNVVIKCIRYSLKEVFT